MNKTVQIKDLAWSINDEILKDYGEQLTKSIKKEVTTAARICREEIQNESPKKTGDYKAGWKAKTVYESSDDIRMQVGNSKEYRLTHLLEHPHVIKREGRVLGTTKAHPHINQAAEHAAERLGKRIKVVIKNGG